MGRVPAIGHGPEAYRNKELGVPLPMHDVIPICTQMIATHRASARWVAAWCQSALILIQIAPKPRKPRCSPSPRAIR
jgi:hypothetical protein